MTTREYNKRYYKKHRKRLIHEEHKRRVMRRQTREANGERLRKKYASKKYNKHGQSMCQHNREWYRCGQCSGGGICEHGGRRYQCRLCSPLGWAKRVLRDIKAHSKIQEYAQPKATAEQVLKFYENRLCILCGGELDWISSRPTLHHSHETGEVMGFTHNACNVVEGIFRRMSDIQVRALIRNYNKEKQR